jgi:hypothetical protein
MAEKQTRVCNPCPKCGSELDIGYGFAGGGGIGPYVYCTSETCDHFVKSQDPDERPVERPA